MSGRPEVSVRATVLIPTFDHGETLSYSVRSALQQTVAEIEVLIVGDGVPPLGRGFIEELIAQDPRVRFFANDKGPRHGEIHRARVLEEAAGEIVCYLADDDLWLPEHVESMLDLLVDADFAHSLPLRVEPEGTLGGWAIDLSREADRELLLNGQNRIPLSFSGHTLEAYRRLPHGWRTTPDDVPTDLYMFQQFLSCDWLRAASGTRVTGLHFPSPDRFGWTPERRCAELEHWAGRIADQQWRRLELMPRVVEVQSRGWSKTDIAARELVRERSEIYQRLSECGHRAQADHQRLLRSGDELVVLRSSLEDTESLAATQAARIEDLETELDRLTGELAWRDRSLTWRLRRAVMSFPAVGGLIRWVGKARSRKAIG